MPAPYPAAVAAARDAAAWCRLPDLAFISVKGKDRAGFLHGLLSADIKTLDLGYGIPACLLTAKGGLVAPLGVHHLPDEHLLAGPKGAVPKAFEVLTKMAPLSDCAVELHDMAAWLVVGPRRAQILEALSGRPCDPGPGGVRAFATSAGNVGVLTDYHTGLKAYVLIVAASGAERFAGVMKGTDAPELPAAALEAFRVENGMPAWGVEAVPDCFPQEVRLGSWVSYEKGCYLGQEVMARLRDRGHVNRLLVGLSLEGTARPGDAVETLAGEKAGALTSVAPGTVALAFLRRERAEDESFVVRSGADKVAASLRRIY